MRVFFQFKKTASAEDVASLCGTIQSLISEDLSWPPQYVAQSGKWQIDSGNNFWGYLEGERFVLSARYANGELLAAIKTICCYRRKDILSEEVAPSAD
jgi:hypothetical protein